ncbi:MULTISPECIES: aspartyl/asparaginyl beta-hydroxylase domain-containing protein [Gammaproteobacteria]|uniref:aspartyl/asparaginyl beta-hydroxylase domain-containing protein n=1 Tax=Gammaproteobacteria TaxID=1236 RepID=UPI000DCF77AD|nr:MULTISPECIES: aspartyl/asparaginyl beta-hydroxylase domain-containing protein [Gammaproteobacteria]RTE85727.1 aspartyl/asparaginyl beta-hydroxylase domain-containing protein [Aliidiomarina sp. B3213]TCZ90271.1 aspartyl/asparaginyl beta-hydroxylase domain-containing protein [Lysobacter sp. N42]
MEPLILILLALATFTVASMVYVYAFRGTYRHPSFNEYARKCWPIFAPLNCMLYMSTQKRARRPILNLDEFPELANVTVNWKTIRDEALALRENNEFEKTKDKNNSGHYDVGFRTFFKYGWSKFYLKWYGYTHDSAKRMCPETVKLIEQIPQVKGAMFTLLPPGGKLTPHSDPFACSLRYHLGLETPNDDNCWINVDNQEYSWRDGEALLFDETYVHHVANNTGKPRLILMLDVERPMGVVGKVVNFFYRQLMRMTIVPNDESDKKGLANAVFSSVSPLLARSKELKETNKPLYKTLKFVVNSILAIVLLGLLALIIYIPYSLISG